MKEMTELRIENCELRIDDEMSSRRILNSQFSILNSVPQEPSR
jgi:hypothetical protein